MSTKKYSRNKEAKIDLIYDTFFKLILKNGYHKTSTNHVAELAKISIGTIYKYFPKGKEDIIRKYFDESMETILNIDALFNIDNDNIVDFLHNFVLKLYNHHKEKKGYNLAFRSAIQSDKTLLRAHKAKVNNFFTELAHQLRKQNENFRQIPEERLIETFIFTFNLINAIVYHHLSIMKLFDTDDNLVEYLTNVIAFSLKYLIKS